MPRSCSLLRLAFSLVGLVGSVLLSSPTAHAAEPLRVIVHYGWGPPMVEDLDGQRGFIFDLYRLIAGSMGRSLDVHLTPRNRVLPDLMQGRADIFCPMAQDWLPKSAQDELSWSGPVYDATDVLVARPEMARAFPGLNSASGTVAAVLGYRHPTLDAAVAAGGLTRENVKTEEQILVGVAAGRTDYGVMDLMVFSHLYAKMTNLRDKLQLAMVLDVRAVECIMPAAAADLTRAIMKVLGDLRRNGVLDRMAARYTGGAPQPPQTESEPPESGDATKVHSRWRNAPAPMPPALLAGTGNGRKVRP